MDHGILLEAGTNEMELLSVILRDQVYGINVAKVKSIKQFDPSAVTHLPDSAQGIIGVLLDRGVTFPIIDLATVLDLGPETEQEPANERKKITIITEFNKTVNSFKVDGVDRIHRLSWSQFVPITELLDNQAYITGTVNIDNREILVLDLEYIFSTLFPELLLKEVTDELMNQKATISRDSLKVFFAEDCTVMRKSVMRLLKEAGFEDILEFINGKLAYEHITGNWDEIAKTNKQIVLISDIEMPQMDGLTLCNNLKTNPVYADIHIIMFSSLINKQMVVKCQRVKADNYITKPEINDLIGMLDDVCKSTNNK